jgi:YD repeat-containing protein
MDLTGALRFSFVGVLTLERMLEYDEENRLVMVNDNVSITSFDYDDGGQRIKKVADGVITYYFFANYEEVVEGGATTTISY